ncbi:2-hydroxy-3-oxopropionate reductase [Minicystis rosea]|nr:2-hydroxy-3-oxopropionate reductase [Minicystis rosea]
MKVGFIGLGNMGLPMAQNLLAAGHSLTVYNRTQARAEALADRGAQVADSPAAAAAGAEAVITMLADDRAVEDVVFGDSGVLQGLAKGAIHVSSSTISVELSARLDAAHHAAGQGYVAAPVFGRPDAAETKQLWVIAAGWPGDVTYVQPIFDAIGRGTTRIGNEAPAANTVKLAGNFIIASMIESLGEAFTLARKSGIDPQLFLEVFRDVMVKSPLFDRYAGLIADEAYEPAGFKMYLGLNNVRLALAAGEAAEVPLPLASLLRDQMLSAVARGMGDLDWAALARISAERAGLGGGR